MTIAPAERVETSLEEIAALDFDIPCFPCDWRGDPPSTAVWFAVRSCGCDPHPYCESCRMNVRGMGATRCKTCGTAVSVRFEPIKP